MEFDIGVYDREVLIYLSLEDKKFGIRWVGLFSQDLSYVPGIFIGIVCIIFVIV